MNEPRSTYQIYAELISPDLSTLAFDEVQLSQTREHNLDQLERASEAHQGQIDLRFVDCLRISFETADAALLCACEMQQCSAMQTRRMGKKFSLRIGIHRCSIRRRANDTVAKDAGFPVKLAASNNAILISEAVVTALTPRLRKLTRMTRQLAPEITAYQVDWQENEANNTENDDKLSTSSINLDASAPYLVLYYGLKTLVLNKDKKVLTIGRDPTSDLALNDAFVSRHHCRIEKQDDRVVLIDSSTNGTSLLTAGGENLLAKRSMLSLIDKGMIFFGQPTDTNGRGAARFEVF